MFSEKIIYRRCLWKEYSSGFKEVNWRETANYLDNYNNSFVRATVSELLKYEKLNALILKVNPQIDIECRT